MCERTRQASGARTGGHRDRTSESGRLFETSLFDVKVWERAETDMKLAASHHSSESWHDIRHVWVELVTLTGVCWDSDTLVSWTDLEKPRPVTTSGVQVEHFKALSNPLHRTVRAGESGPRRWMETSAQHSLRDAGLVLTGCANEEMTATGGYNTEAASHEAQMVFFSTAVAPRQRLKCHRKDDFHYLGGGKICYYPLPLCNINSARKGLLLGLTCGSF